MLAGVYPGNVDKKDNKLVVLWEETYIRNMRYAAQRLQEVTKTVLNGRSNPEVVGSIPTEVKRFFLYLVWFPDSLY